MGKGSDLVWKMDSISNVNSSSVRDFIAKEVADWDDDVIAVARFKAFSGQRCDWEPSFLFWKQLIIKIATHFRLLLIRPSEVSTRWYQVFRISISLFFFFFSHLKLVIFRLRMIGLIEEG